MCVHKNGGKSMAGNGPNQTTGLRIMKRARDMGAGPLTLEEDWPLYI